jgi:aspartate/methionine/tyrosine aminotransferase
MLISPHNPTGHVVRESVPELNEMDIPIIADEVFCEFPFALRSVPPVGALHPDTTVFHLNGISKMFALPDLKLGWIAISGPRAHQYLDGLELLNDTLLGANALAQAMLPTLFERGNKFLRSMRDQVQSNLLVALTHLHNIDWVHVAPPLGGTYLFPQVVDCHDEDLLLEEMLAAGLFAQPGYFYDEERGCFLVISGLLNRQTLAEGLTRLKQVLDVA